MTELRSALIHLYIYKPTFRDFQCVYNLLHVECNRTVSRSLFGAVAQSVDASVGRKICNRNCVCVYLRPTEFAGNCLLYRYDWIVHYTLVLSPSLT